MATALTSIFGYNIIVSAQPRQVDRQRTGMPGVKGLLSMNLGTRGRQIIVAGILYSTVNTSYELSRASLQSTIDAIEAMQDLDAASYSFMSTTYDNVEFDKLQFVPDGSGKVFHQTMDGYVFVNFVAYLRELI